MIIEQECGFNVCFISVSANRYFSPFGSRPLLRLRAKIVVRDEGEAVCSLENEHLAHPRSRTSPYNTASTVEHRHIEAHFLTTLVLTKHGLLKKMKGVRRNIISPKGGDRSYDEGRHQAEYGQFSNGCKDKFRVILCRGDC